MPEWYQDHYSERGESGGDKEGGDKGNYGGRFYCYALARWEMVRTAVEEFFRQEDLPSGIQDIYPVGFVTSVPAKIEFEWTRDKLPLALGQVALMPLTGNDEL